MFYMVGTSQMDGAILVVAATDGTMPQTREHLLLAKRIGLKHVVVYINKADLVDKDTLELVELEVMELLHDYGFDENSTPIIIGSALCALDGKNPEIGENSIVKLMEAVDQHVPLPTRETDGAFVLPIENAFTVPGRGTVVIGTLQRGTIKKGDEAEVIGHGNQIKTVATDIQVFKNSVPQATAGENIGVLLRGVKKELVQRGMFLSVPGNLKQVEHFRARLYVLKRSEGGRSKPVTTNYINMMFVDTWNMACCLRLPESQAMAMPGDVVEASIMLRSPMVLREGDKFLIRENQLTALSGVVTEILPPSGINIKGFNYEIPKPQAVEGNSSVVMRRRRTAKATKAATEKK